MNSLKKSSEDKLPDRCGLYSSLKNKCIIEKYYLHTIDVWNVYKLNTIGDYHDLYLKKICFIIS